ncbi:hypothetical protein NC796_26280, partial [Aliifodinibius sp. S!AR15-10]
MLVKGLFSFEHIVNGHSQAFGDDGQRFGLPVAGDQPIVIFLGQLVATHLQQRCFGKGPPQVGVADPPAGGPVDFAIGRFLPLDQPGVGT